MNVNCWFGWLILALMVSCRAANIPAASMAGLKPLYLAMPGLFIEDDGPAVWTSGALPHSVMDLVDAGRSSGKPFDFKGWNTVSLLTLGLGQSTGD